MSFDVVVELVDDGLFGALMNTGGKFNSMAGISELNAGDFLETVSYDFGTGVFSVANVIWIAAVGVVGQEFVDYHV